MSRDSADKLQLKDQNIGERIQIAKFMAQIDLHQQRQRYLWFTIVTSSLVLAIMAIATPVIFSETIETITKVIAP